ncbi:DUF3397 domain-containing protein [Convivina praedatoris]|uniref:DUF3397 domain-containing protein n=1 Tax=Convivina praedatoris TaxID=2880963 RepID=A0ABM9D2I3_9LACO|nr:DUF3397 domain-containing protein [Convivina sp. LMG 32447]CAH1854318.1 hypothetical protein R077815_01013 [Convivina sp. LMG 32447]CAH1855544.1 hypothetical protein R078138_01148 [Convivina sp. LMG 32447]CAH1855638.1 hypothetical protein LMG032447_01127 [Convivina sp. LMG 32447]
MDWKYWALGLLGILILLYLFRRFSRTWRQVSFFDLAVLPSWITLYMTMGLAFGVSYLPFILVIWLFLGLIFSWWLLGRNWPVHVFFHKYWQWSALVAILAELIVVIMAVYLQK